MHGRARLILLVLLPSAAHSQSLFPSGLARFAGKDNSAYTGDNGPAYYAKFRAPAALARDAAGNLYIAEAARIRKIDTRGIITTIAPANNPGGIAVDSRGNLYFSENQVAIRRLAPDGTLTNVAIAAGVAPQGLAIDPRDARDRLYFTDVRHWRVFVLQADGSTALVAGTGSAGTAGEGGPATAADLYNPWQLAFDPAGNLYVADTLRLLKIDARGTLTKIASVAANGVAVDAAGNVYAASSGLSKITPDGVVHPVTATAAGCSAPATVAAHNVLLGPDGNLYALTFSLLQQISPDAKLTTLAGAGPNLFTGDGGPAANATFAAPAGIAFDPSGRLYVADSGNNRVRVIDSTGAVRTIAGDGAPTYDQDAACLPDNDSFLRNPQAVAVDSAGNVYIADTGKNRIRKVAADGTQSTLASGLQQPIGIAVDAAGNVYVGEKGKRVIRIDSRDSKGAATPVATARVSGTLAVDAAGAVLISATYEIDRLRPDGMLVPVAGTGQPAQTVAGRFQETIVNAAGVAIDSAGNIFVADSGKPAIQRTSTACAIAAGTDPQLQAPSGIALDSAGNLYIADSGAGAIWKAAALPPPAGEAPTPHIAISPVRSAAPALVPPPPFEPNHFGPTVVAQEAVAPGELIRISGACIGPFDPVAASFDAAGRLPNSLGDVQVAISGFPVPLISVSAGDIVAVVPYGLEGVSGPNILLGLRYRGVLDQNTITVQPANPALFTTSLATDGPAIALNQDGSLNSAALPASPGSVISLWATGTGQTLPSSLDGQAAPVENLLRLKLPVRVSIGGQDAEVLFAGAAPGFAGLTQINVRVPASAAPGSALVKMTVGGTPLNQGAITIWLSE